MEIEEFHKKRLQNRFYRRAKIKKTDTNEEIRKKILKFAEVKRNDYGVIILPEELVASVDFMLSLYNTNGDLLNVLRPDKINSPLVNDVDFMIEYVKLVYKENKIMHKKHYIVLKPRNELLWALQECSSSLLNPEFIQKLAKAFPDINILDVAEAKIVRVDGYAEEIQMFNKMLTQLPREFIEDQVSKFGEKALLALPVDFKDFDKLVALGVKKDGFKSLRMFDVKKLLDNKDLVVEAYNVDGREALKDFINNGLSPFRVKRLKFNDINADTCYERYFDPDFDKIQSALLKDPVISDLMNGKDMVKEEAKEEKYDFSRSGSVKSTKEQTK